MFFLSSAGRVMDVTSSMLDIFKDLVVEHGISADTIIINQNNGTERTRVEEI